MTFWPLTNSDFPTDQTFHQFHDLYTELDLHRIMSGFHGAFATGVASQQGTLTLPDTWFRPPYWDLLMLQLLRPNSSNLPCLYLTFHLEYPLVPSRFCLWQDLSCGTKMFDLVTLTLKFYLSTFKPEVIQIGLSYCICVFIMTIPFTPCSTFFLPCDLDLLKNFNLRHSFQTRRLGAFILHMCIPCDKTFHVIPKFLTLWPWPWRSRLTYFLKNFNLGHNYQTRRGRAFILKCVFRVTITFMWYTNFWPWPWSLAYFWKTLTLAIILKQEVVGLSYYTWLAAVAQR